MDREQRLRGERRGACVAVPFAHRVEQQAEETQGKKNVEPLDHSSTDILQVVHALDDAGVRDIPVGHDESKKHPCWYKSSFRLRKRSC